MKQTDKQNIIFHRINCKDKIQSFKQRWSTSHSKTGICDSWALTKWEKKTKKWKKKNRDEEEVERDKWTLAVSHQNVAATAAAPWTTSVECVSVSVCGSLVMH